MRFIANVRVSLKESVLDPQGETIGRALRDLGFDSIVRTSTGKLFKLEIDANSEADAKKVASEAASKLLANPIIERFDIEVVR